MEAALPAHTRLRHYFWEVRPECLQPDWLGLPEYLTEVRERRSRRGLTELRTGLHWGAEETGRRTVPFTARAQRVCPHSQEGSIEDARHIVFDCPLFAPERERWPALFAGPPSLHAFFQQPAPAQFTCPCQVYRRLLPPRPPSQRAAPLAACTIQHHYRLL